MGKARHEAVLGILDGMSEEGAILFIRRLAEEDAGILKVLSALRSAPRRSAVQKKPAPSAAGEWNAELVSDLIDCLRKRRTGMMNGKETLILNRAAIWLEKGGKHD